MESFSPLFFRHRLAHLKIILLKTVYYTKVSIIRYAIHHINICRLNAYFKCYPYAIAEKNTRKNHFYIYI